MSRRSIRRRIAYALINAGGRILPDLDNALLRDVIDRAVQARKNLHTLPAPKQSETRNGEKE